MTKITVGKYSYGVDPSKVIDWGDDTLELNVGAFTSVADGVIFMMGDGLGHRTKWTSTYPFGHIHQSVFDLPPDCISSKGNITIGNDVWIGLNAYISHGVTIGDGAIIGAHAVVTKDVEPYAIVAGNPATFKKYRFDKEIIARLVKIEWWKYSDDKIQAILPFLHQDPTHRLLDEIEQAATRQIPNVVAASPVQAMLALTLAYCDACLKREDYTSARLALCRALALAPDSPDILCRRGRLALFLKDTETAKRDFTHAVEIDSRCSAAWSGLARYHLLQEEREEAETAVERALGIDPLNTEAIQVKTKILAVRRISPMDRNLSISV
jgi:acetyltransferase-like isoleucine patch superfamily enzyme